MVKLPKLWPTLSLARCPNKRAIMAILRAQRGKGHPHRAALLWKLCLAWLMLPRSVALVQNQCHCQWPRTIEMRCLLQSKSGLVKGLQLQVSMSKLITSAGASSVISSLSSTVRTWRSCAVWEAGIIEEGFTKDTDSGETFKNYFDPGVSLKNRN